MLAALDDLRRAQARRLTGVLLLVRNEWSAMGDDLDSSWSRVGPRVELLTSAAMVGAASDGAASVGYALAEQGSDLMQVGRVNPAAWASMAADGRPLNSLLYGAVVKAREADASSLSARLEVGGKWLDMAVHTQVSDALRQGSRAATVATPRAGLVRIATSPCCKRCAVLNGHIYKWRADFQRHPRCDCIEGPTDGRPSRYMVDSVRSEDIRDLTRAERQAIDDGADMNAVINAGRKVSRSKDGMTTSEGTTRRGYASSVRREIARQRGEIAAETATNVGKRGAVKGYRVRRTERRLTPTAIYKHAASREEAVKLLAANGYIVGDIKSIAAMAL